MQEFYKQLEALWDDGRFTCVGLDTSLNKIPPCLINEHGATSMAVLQFNKAIIDATIDSACAFKPNLKRYEHSETLELALKQTIQYIKIVAPHIPVILDSKSGDIGSSNDGAVAAAFNRFGADAATINPLFGKEAYEPFLNQTDKGIVVLVKTSNEGSKEFQDLVLEDGRLFYQYVAYRIAHHWNDNKNIAVVVGATYPEELAKVREIIGDDMPILIPGIGAQGGDLVAAVRAGINSRGTGIVINSARDIIYASDGADFAKDAGRAAKKLNDQIKAIIASLLPF